MKKLRICSVLLIGLMIMGGTAWAFDNVDHVKAAPNGKGDLIFFPWYYAGSGYETKLTVINTSDVYSSVAKLVIRSHNWSEELLDFLIYLSPNDVWTGYLRVGANGTYIYSDDDSILVRIPAASGVVDDDFASVSNPVSQPLFAVSCTSSDSTNYGYVEVIESNAVLGLTKIAGTNKVAKKTIYSWYHATPEPTPVITPNILTAYQEFSNRAYGLNALIRAEIYSDWDNTENLTVANVTGLTSPSRNTLGELEAAMSKSSVALPYINYANGDFAIHIFNFPTKLSWENSICTKYLPYGSSPYFMRVAGDLVDKAKCESYTPQVYDLMENTPSISGSPFSGGDPGTKPQMCEEVEIIGTVLAGEVFREGWIRYNWDNTAGVKNFVALDLTPGTFTGTPVLPLVLFFKSAAVSQAVPAYDHGDVTEDAAVYPFFQNSQYDHLGVLPPG